MTLTSREIHLIERPEGLPKVEQFNVYSRELDAPADNQLVIKNLYMSLDPAMRTPLSNGMTGLGEPIAGHCIGEVIESRHPGFSNSDIVLHRQGFREFVLSDGEEVKVLDIQEEPVSAHLGVLGINGLSAYAGLLEVAGLKEKENVLVTAAAGAVGSIAVQIARIKSCHVIGSAGGASKCAWLQNVAGVDEVIDYKEGVFRKRLKAAASDGIDVFFDNVGGEQLNAALPRMNERGRIALCGMISAYNNPGALSEGITTMAVMMYKRIRMEGFVVWDYEHLLPQFYRDMRAWLSGGEIKYEETIVEGIENAPAALIGLFTGQNLGKMLVKF